MNTGHRWVAEEDTAALSLPWPEFDARINESPGFPISWDAWRQRKGQAVKRLGANLCSRGHDRTVVGTHQRMCRECRRMNDRARWPKRQAADTNGRALRQVRARIERTKAAIRALWEEMS